MKEESADMIEKEEISKSYEKVKNSKKIHHVRENMSNKRKS
jgi:hypothetical protein